MENGRGQVERAVDRPFHLVRLIPGGGFGDFQALAAWKGGGEGRREGKETRIGSHPFETHSELREPVSREGRCISPGGWEPEGFQWCAGWSWYRPAEMGTAMDGRRRTTPQGWGGEAGGGAGPFLTSRR